MSACFWRPYCWMMSSLLYLFILLVVFYLPSLPFVFHLRIIYYVCKAKLVCLLRGKGRGRDNQGRLSLLEWWTLSSIVWVDDIDINIHMNNSCYFKHADIARISLLIGSGAYTLASKNGWLLAHGGTQITFKKELGPCQRYTLQVRLHSWGKKWMYFEHRFMVGSRVHAIGISKFVCKKRDRSDVKPIELLKMLGYTHLPITNNPSSSTSTPTSTSTLSSTKQLPLPDITPSEQNPGGHLEKLEAILDQQQQEQQAGTTSRAKQN
eukprot:TRINITY_DN4498_c0_g1_i3.p1 TRINITY_DN4498_c0_g1~~TRINITY_DN4498_c0_g1_i3.p1  ORF type:complete len:297 (-),score=42.32 TRINITY_DN4498_c0_g1_i3:25-819(-)